MRRDDALTEEKELGLKDWLLGPKRRGSKVEARPEKRRVAVLPFANMSPDPKDDYFADGMTEEIISTLSRIEHAEVISRTSVMQYKKSPKPLKEVSKELDVGTVLEGSVRKAGNKLRVTVQMIDAVNDRHLWVDSYDRELEDIFAIQTDVARRVAEALDARLGNSVPGTVEGAGNVEAYSMYLRGMQLYHENTEASLQEAIALFEKAIAKNAGFSRAYTGLAYALSGLAVGYEDFTNSITKAETAARKALELRPNSAEALVALAHVHLFMDRFKEAANEAEKAVKINPNLAEAHRSIGWIYVPMGKLEEGLKDLQRAYRLDPMSFRPGTELTLVLQLAGRESEALQFLERLRDLYPKSHRVYARWAEFFLLKHDYVNAQKMLDAGFEISPKDIDLLTDQGVLYVLTDRRREAQEVLRNIESDNEEYSRLQGRLFIHAAMGNLDEAFKALTRLAEIHAWPPLIKSLPVFQQIRKDSRFSSFCRSVGLPP